MLQGGGALLGLLSLLTLALSSNLVLSPDSASAASSTKNLNITANVKDAISLTLSTNSIAFDITPTPNGVFNTGSFNATVSTTNQTGYTLYVSTPTSTDMSGNTTGNTDVISTLPTSVLVPATTNPSTGDITYNAGNFTNNTWGYSSSLFGTGSNTTFKPFSTTNYKITPVVSGTGSTATYADVTSEQNIQNDTTDITIGAKIDTNIYADTYSNIVTVTALANPVFRTFTINYSLDGGTLDEQTGTYTQTEDIQDDYTPTITLSSDIPTKVSHNFLGYATTSDGEPVYQPGDTIQMNYEDPIITLYAKWQKYYTFSLTYDYNGGSGSIDPNPKVVTTTGTSTAFTIPSTTPTRSGYTFLGWSDTQNATSASYTAGNTKTLESPMSENGHSATLYAVWVRTYSSLSAGCSSTSNGGIFMYNSVQYIKLADGKCWTRYSQGRATFDGANSLCPSGTSVPNITQANALLTAYGATSTTTYGYNTYYINSAALYNATGWYGTGSDAFRVSTLNPSSTSYSYVLLVRPTEAFSNLMGHLSPCVALTSSCPVVCVAN